MSLFAYVLLENIKYTILVTAIVLVVFFPWWDEYVVNFMTAGDWDHYKLYQAD